jgi:hypothetical protein
MKTCLCLFLVSCSWASAQSSDLFDKAPPPIDEALRARVKQFYDAHVSGKFREAFALVAEDSQDTFFAAGKQQYKTCETIRINYTEQYARATVIESCKSDWTWHGITTPTTFPLTSSWKLVDGQWYWSYVKPTIAPSPFSPTGYVSVPADQDSSGANASKPAVAADLRAMTEQILKLVKLDKNEVLLHADHTSKDTVHIRNEMPGQVTLSIDPLPLPGLKMTLTKTELKANEETDIVFEYRLDDATITCGECAQRVHSSMTAQIHVQPTGQMFPITINFATPKSGAIPLPKK